VDGFAAERFTIRDEPRRREKGSGPAVPRKDFPRSHRAVSMAETVGAPEAPRFEYLRSPLRGHELGSPATDFVVGEIDESPHPKGGVPLHRHRSEDEAWYVLSGRLRFQVGSREFDAIGGDGVLLPRGIAHTFWNPGPDPARYLLIAMPKTAALIRALHAPDRTEPEATLYERFEVDLLDAAPP
jgi:mannose-6-phosphate isomerase-like protein (cupin superfamily)